jgi:leucyl aminopeptidase (aminopeptidase T)
MPRQEALEAAAHGILARLGDPEGGHLRILCAYAKRPLAETLLQIAGARGVTADLDVLARDPDRSTDAPTGLAALQGSAARGMLVILAGVEQAPWLFETVGRPDRGIRLSGRFYCDWLMDYDGLVRVLGARYATVNAWRVRLVDALDGSRRLRVQTQAGTDLLLEARGWQAEDGEVYTAPHEGSAQGVVLVDGAVYDGPVRSSFRLRVTAGRVVNPGALDLADRQQRLLNHDLTRDAGAALVAELGLGTNPAALAHAGIMEAEMALGTCHVGFGHNLPYGGENASATHTDVGLLRPTLTADGRTLCREGIYCL